METQTSTREEESPSQPAPESGSTSQHKGSAAQPAFLESFPVSPELSPLVDAFVRGDYAMVRREAPRLAQRTENAAVRDAALELANRIRPDPLVRYVLGATAVLLLLLVFWIYGGHAH